MRKGVKRLVIAGVILFAVGIIGGGIAFGIAAANGEWHRGRWGIFHGTGTVVEAEYPGETIERVVVDMGAGQLKIKRGETFSIYGEGLYNDFRNEIVDGTWHIGQGEEDNGFWDLFHSAGEIELTIPENIELSELSLSVGAGELEAESVNAGQLSVTCGAGRVSIDEAKADQVNISCGVGEVELGLWGTEADFRPDVTCNVGEVTIGDRHYKGLNHNTNETNAKLNVHCGVGKVEVSFLE
ncbi:DUF4097 family beta strand repeat-containing protein [Cuneatibacter sp. NSJ-177]|uniref:DUF4097 family beta strand repeat-containing protein n=1 Tax=Cuneatibacter sp. NSJ-177 TaxID=2931401 RepID=UPI001FD61427|nr:DUF4097 family beta strand repeat-containing protein [Cuneatibacter sp. NSJ-177]MCJ7834171.1 DUF4097 family beta strand repeat-containing protein [Cuneatibacter sp. NSJ-177]